MQKTQSFNYCQVVIIKYCHRSDHNQKLKGHIVLALRLRKMTCTQISANSNAENMDLLGTVHCDVRGPMGVAWNGKAQCFVTFIERVPRWTTVCPMKETEDVFDCFKSFFVHAESVAGSN